MSYNIETKMYEGYIYKIWNDINDKLYIGQTITTVAHRWGQHTSNQKRKHTQAIYNAMQKYGKNNFHIEEIVKIQCVSEEDLIKQLNELEKSYIKSYHSHVDENGYNITFGGENVSDRIRQPVVAFNKSGELLFEARSITEMSEITGKTLNVIIRCCNGETVPRDDYVFRYKGDQFEKYRTSVNKPHPVKTFCFTKDGEYVTCFDSIIDASVELQIPYGHIQNAIYNKTITNGYYFSKDNLFDYIPLNGNKVGVDVYTVDGLLIGKYISISEAMRSVGLDVVSQGQSNIRQCLNGKQKLAFGYVWRYTDEPFEKYKVIPRLSYMKCINVYDLDCNYVDTFISQISAAQDLGCDAGCINSCLKGRNKTHKGYRFYYADDPNQPDKSKITNASSKELFELQVAQHKQSCLN